MPYMQVLVAELINLKLGNNVQVCSNSVVNKSFEDNNIVLGGMPAVIKKYGVKPWYQGWEAEEWRNQVEELKKQLGL